MKEIIEIPFGASDSELQEFEMTIPEGMTAKIKDGKIIVNKAESEDERIRKEIIECIETLIKAPGASPRLCDWLAYLEKQGDSEKELAAAKIEGKIAGINEVVNNPSRYNLKKENSKSTDSIKPNCPSDCRHLPAARQSDIQQSGSHGRPSPKRIPFPGRGGLGAISKMDNVGSMRSIATAIGVADDESIKQIEA